MPGKNAPPMHPNCRCSTAAYEDDEEYRAWLDYLAKGGTTEEWESSGKAEWIKNKNQGFAKSMNDGIINKNRALNISIQFFAEKDIKNQDSNSLKRSIRRFQSRIEEHEAKLNNPGKIYPEWDNFDRRYQEGLKRHWSKEIRNFKQSIQDRIDELKKRGDYDE